jgi:hypothetical protein
LPYARDRAEAYRRVTAAEDALIARLPTRERELLTRWRAEVQRPALILVGLVRALAEATGADASAAVVDRAQCAWEDGAISAADALAVLTLARILPHAARNEPGDAQPES